MREALWLDWKKRTPRRMIGILEYIFYEEKSRVIEWLAWLAGHARLLLFVPVLAQAAHEEAEWSARWRSLSCLARSAFLSYAHFRVEATAITECTSVRLACCTTFVVFCDGFVAGLSGGA